MGIAAEVQVAVQTILVQQLCGGIAFGLVEAVLGDLGAVVPPFHHRVKVGQQHGLCLGEMLVALGHIQTVEPGLLRGAGAVKEQDIRGDGGIGREDAAGHPDHGMEVELLQELALDVQLGVVGAEEEAVGQDHGGPTVLLEPVHHHGHKQIRRLGAGQVRREMVLDLGLLVAAVGGIHEDHIKLIFLGVVQHVLQQAVVVIDLGHVHAVEQHVRHAEHIGELLLLNAIDGAAEGFLIGHGGDVLLQRFQPACEEAAGAAGEIYKDAVFDTNRKSLLRHISAEKGLK